MPVSRGLSDFLHSAAWSWCARMHKRVHRVQVTTWKVTSLSNVVVTTLDVRSAGNATTVRQGSQTSMNTVEKQRQRFAEPALNENGY